MDFAGLRVAIGGAGQGVGASCARLFAEKKARVLLCARSQQDLDSLSAELKKTGAEISSIAADLGTDSGATLFARAAHERLGGVDLGLICAGIAQRPKRLIELATMPSREHQHDRAALLGQLQGNAIAPALAAIALARAWSHQDARAVKLTAPDRKPARQLLVLSSMVTRLPAQQGLGPYLAAKSALEALVRTLAEELWPQVRINALCLGPVRTRLHERAGTPLELSAQFPTPEEIAPLVHDLLEALSPGVTGGPSLSGRCIDADAFAADREAALWGDGRLAQLHSLQPPPSDSREAAPEAEPGRAPSGRVRRAVRETAASLQRYPTDANLLARRLAALHHVEPDSVLLSGGGATALLEQALTALGERGDELVSPFPTFEIVSALASRAGLRHRMVPARRTQQGLFEPHSARELANAIGPRTRAVYVATPDNPTGALLPLEEERALRRALGPHTALILDEAWSLALPGERESELETASPQGSLAPIIRLYSLSKLHGLAGIRVGYALASPMLAALLRRLSLPFPLGAPQLAAALAALDELPRARKIAMVMLKKRARMVSKITALGLLASEGSSPLILVRDPRPGATAGPLLFALAAAGIAAQEGHWDPAALTISLGTPAQDRRALAALARGLAQNAAAPE